MKRYFLIDYEAVQNLDGIENLNETDVVILLFMDDSKGVSFRTLAKMNASKAEIQQKFVNGKNETDMCYAVAFIIGQISSKGDEIILIAKSNDFSLFLKTFTEDANIKLSDYESIENFLKNEPEEIEEEPEAPSFNGKSNDDYNELLIKFGITVPPFFDRIINFIEKSRHTLIADANIIYRLALLFWAVRDAPKEINEKIDAVSDITKWKRRALEAYVAWYQEILKEENLQ